MSSTAIAYRGYTLQQAGGLWHVYESLVEVMPDDRPGAAPRPMWIDRYIQLDLAKRFVRRHRELSREGARP